MQGHFSDLLRHIHHKQKLTSIFLALHQHSFNSTDERKQSFHDNIHLSTVTLTTWCKWGHQSTVQHSNNPDVDVITKGLTYLHPRHYIFPVFPLRGKAPLAAHYWRNLLGKQQFALTKTDLWIDIVDAPKNCFNILSLMLRFQPACLCLCWGIIKITTFPFLLLS